MAALSHVLGIGHGVALVVPLFCVWFVFKCHSEAECKDQSVSF